MRSAHRAQVTGDRLVLPLFRCGFARQSWPGLAGSAMLPALA